MYSALISSAKQRAEIVKPTLKSASISINEVQAPGTGGQNSLHVGNCQNLVQNKNNLKISTLIGL